MTYDPAFMNTAACRSRITYIDGDKGILLLPRLPDRAAGRAQHLPRDGLPDPERRAADGRRSCRTWTHEITMHTMVHENIKKFMEGFRYDAHPMGIFVSTVGALSTFYPDAQAASSTPSRGSCRSMRLIAKMPTHRRLRLPPQHRPALRLPRQRPQLHRQLPEHAVQDDRAAVQAEPGARARARRALHPARRPRAELLHQRDARHRQLARRSVSRRWPARPRRSTARCTAAPTRPCCGCWRRSARSTNIPAFIKRVKAGEGRLMGFGHRVYKSYDPRAKIIKQHRRRGVRGHRARTRCSTSRSSSSASRSRTSTSSSRKLYPNVDFYSGPHLPGDGLPGGDVPGAVRHPAHRRAGWRSGRRCCSTRSRRSRGRGRSTPAPPTRDYVSSGDRA